MYCIQKYDKPNLLSRWFKIVKLEGNKIYIPIVNYEKKDKQLKLEEKLAKKTKKILKKLNSKKVVLSKEIKNHTKYMNLLQTYQLDIIDGRWLFRMLVPEIIEYVENKKELEPEETTIHILANDFTEVVIENIKKLAQNHKHIAIITKNISKMKKIEEQILEETGSMITVMNNKKKSLAKAQLIINFDFPTELLKQYAIFEDSTIIDVTGNIKILKKRFNGVIITNYEIDFKNKSEYKIDDKSFFARDLYEAEFYKNQPYKYVREKIKRDGIYICNLYTKNQIL